MRFINKTFVRAVYIIIVISFAYFIIKQNISKLRQYCFSSNPRNCGINLKVLLNVQFSDLQEISEHSLIFIESQNSTFLSPRNLCAIESAAKHHPDFEINVFMTASRIFETPVTAEVLQEYSNIYIKVLNVEEIFKDSLLDSWYRKQLWLQSFWPVAHFSDTLR